MTSETHDDGPQVEIASLVRQMVFETLKESAPGIADPMRKAIANSVAMKLRKYFIEAAR